MGLFDTVNKDEERAAITRVRSGQGSNRDREIAEKASRQAGSTGNDAREALKEDAKKANQPKSWF